MDYQNQYGLVRSSSSTQRSLSVASTTSSASHHSSFRPESRAISPASVISVPAPSMLTRTHSGLPSSSCYTLPSTLLPVSSPYRQSQVMSTVPLCTPVPPPRVFDQQFPFSFNFHLNTLPHRPSPLSYQAYPLISPSLGNESAYYQSSPVFETQPTVKFFKWALIPPEIMKVIRARIGYLGSRKLVGLNKWFKDNFDIRHFSENELVAGVLEAEQRFGRYHIESQKTWFGCYHCYQMKSPKNFERFSWHCGGENGYGDIIDGEEIESHHSASAAAVATTPNTQRSRSSSLATPPNPYYDPTITRTSILQAQAAVRKSSRGRCNTPAMAAATVAPGLPAPRANDPTAASPISTRGRVKSTWGVRRFCIACGIKKGFYRSTDLIEVHGARNLVNWVCGCLEVRDRSISPSCNECGLHSRYEPPGKRRQRP